jgi:hypothetical protein
VLERLDPTDLTMLAQVGRPWLAAVLASGLPRLPKGVTVRLQLSDFCTSAERLAWAKVNGCPWGITYDSYWTDHMTEMSGCCEIAAGGGHVEALQWARAHGCPWDEATCACAAWGHLEVLRWARAQGCEWDEETCMYAAWDGHLEVLQWAREQDPPCPWDQWTCQGAAEGGHLEVLRWAREQDPPCPWYERAVQIAAEGGHLEVLKWARAGSRGLRGAGQRAVPRPLTAVTWRC